MIKIIKPGTIIKEKQCENCGCLFSYEKEDANHITHFDSKGDYAFGYDYIICPQCKKVITLGDIQ